MVIDGVFHQKNSKLHRQWGIHQAAKSSSKHGDSNRGSGMTSEVDVLHKTTRQDNTYGDGSNPVMPYLGGCTSMYGYHFL